MSRSGKTLTIFLSVFFLLLISLTAIVTFFFLNEREMRMNTEQKLTVSEDSRVKVEAEYKLAQDEIVVLNNRLAEQDNKISGLMDELELEKGLKEEIKKENANMKTQVDSLDKDLKKFQNDVIAFQEKNTFLEGELASAKDLRDQVAAKLQEAEAKIKELEAKISSATPVELEKIVVTPEDVSGENQKPAGKILKVNAENNFVIIDLGVSSGIAENATVEFYRGEALLGEGKITRVQTVMSAVDVLAPLSADKLQISDKVIIKK